MITFDKIRCCLVATSIISGISFLAIPAYADEYLAKEATHKVNIAARQRMLSQRMSMAACFAAVGIDPDSQFEKLSVAYNEFSQVHHGLRFGDDELDIHAEVHKSVVDALNQVETDWHEYTAIAEGLMSIQMISGSALANMDETGLRILADMNIAVSTMTSKYSADLDFLPEVLALSIDFAGRERMLTQKMAKELCLVSAGVEVDANMENLRQSHAQFNTILTALHDGIPYMIVAAPTEEIKVGLENVQAVWEKPNAVFTTILAGGEFDGDDVSYIAEEIDAVLMAMNDTALLYQNLHGLVDY